MRSLCNPSMFKTLVFSEPEAYFEPWYFKILNNPENIGSRGGRGWGVGGRGPRLVHFDIPLSINLL